MYHMSEKCRPPADIMCGRLRCYLRFIVKLQQCYIGMRYRGAFSALFFDVCTQPLALLSQTYICTEKKERKERKRKVELIGLDLHDKRHSEW